MRVIASDESRARRFDNGDIPWHFTARRTKFHWGSRRSADGWSQKISWARKSQQRRVMWPLREGREIWGVDGAFASISWWRDCVRDGVAPSANELAWFYKGSDIGHARGVPKAWKAHAALSYLWKRTTFKVKRGICCICLIASIVLICVALDKSVPYKNYPHEKIL